MKLASLFSSCFLISVVGAFTTPRIGTTTTGSRIQGRGALATRPTITAPLAASSTSGGGQQDLFKAGLLANLEDEAAALASKKIRSVSDLGWKGPAKRRGNTRPRHWAFGGAGEKAVQDKPNYDPSSPLCVEKWLSLSEFYAIIKDDTAIADTIFVALAKGGAFIERDVAEEVIAQWRPGTKFDEAAFLKTVQEGRRDFLTGWAFYLTITGIAVSGIVFPTNPLQLAFVDLFEQLFG